MKHKSEKPYHMSKEKMSHEGYVQGDMSPKVEDYQRPGSSFSQAGFSKTTEYVERQDRMQNEMAHDIEKQAYKGRYS
jgi:hypothetical protein